MDGMPAREKNALRSSQAIVLNVVNKLSCDAIFLAYIYHSKVGINCLLGVE